MAVPCSVPWRRLRGLWRLLASLFCSFLQLLLLRRSVERGATPGPVAVQRCPLLHTPSGAGHQLQGVLITTQAGLKEGLSICSWQFRARDLQF